jgi:alanine racemase
MDMIVVDVTDIFSVKMGDVAVIIGKSGKEEITAGELARFMGTTDYEVLTTINPLIKKFYI